MDGKAIKPGPCVARHRKAQDTDGLLCYYSLDSVAAALQLVEAGSVGKANNYGQLVSAIGLTREAFERILTVVARAVKQVTTARRVEVEKDTRDDNDFLFKTSLEEVEAVGDRARQALKVEPQVECAVRNVFNHETHVTQALNYVVTLVLFYNS